MKYGTEFNRNRSVSIILITTALLLASACSMPALFNPGNAEAVASLSTQNALLSTQVAVQDALLATQSAEDVPRDLEESTAQEQNSPDPTVDMQVTGSHPSPDDSTTALILDDGILAIENSTGSRQLLYETKSITSVSWFPDGSAIALSELVEDEDSPLQVRDQILIIDTETGEASVLADGFEPAVSPDGRWIAYYAGIMYGDACAVGWRLAFTELDEGGNVLQTYTQDDFTGLPDSQSGDTFYPSPSDEPAHPGTWTGSVQFDSFFRRACVEQPTEDGVYRFDLEEMTAERISGSN